MLEIIVVFSLLTVVSGVGFFSFVTYSERQDLQQTTQNVVQDMEKARSDAVSSVKPGSCGTLSAYEIALCAEASCENVADYEVYAICDGTRQVIRSGDIGDGVSLNDSTTCSTLFYSLPNGSASGGFLPCVMVFESDNYSQTATVSESGNITISGIE